jgi:ribosome-binding ATPase YchF (GTP1/OBG family)
MARLYYLTEKQKEEAEFHQDMLFRILKKMVYAPNRAEAEINAAANALKQAKAKIQKLKDEKENSGEWSLPEVLVVDEVIQRCVDELIVQIASESK